MRQGQGPEGQQQCQPHRPEHFGEGQHRRYAEQHTDQKGQPDDPAITAAGAYHQCLSREMTGAPGVAAGAAGAAVAGGWALVAGVAGAAGAGAAGVEADVAGVTAAGAAGDVAGAVPAAEAGRP
ncbi:hypothetical protein D3C76_1312280 [compost metagenome]